MVPWCMEKKGSPCVWVCVLGEGSRFAYKCVQAGLLPRLLWQQLPGRILAVSCNGSLLLSQG